MPPKYGNPDDGGRNELPMPERAAECRMQGQQQYIMELAQEAKIPDTGERSTQIRMMPLRG